MNWEKKTEELTDLEKEIFELIDKKKNETEALRKILESIEKKERSKDKIARYIVFSNNKVYELNLSILIL